MSPCWPGPAPSGSRAPDDSRIHQPVDAVRAGRQPPRVVTSRGHLARPAAEPHAHNQGSATALGAESEQATDALHQFRRIVQVSGALEFPGKRDSRHHGRCHPAEPCAGGQPVLQGTTEFLDRTAVLVRGGRLQGARNPDAVERRARIRPAQSAQTHAHRTGLPSGERLRVERAGEGDAGTRAGRMPECARSRRQQSTGTCPRGAAAMLRWPAGHALLLRRPASRPVAATLPPRSLTVANSWFSQSLNHEMAALT